MLFKFKEFVNESTEMSVYYYSTLFRSLLTFIKEKNISPSSNIASILLSAESQDDIKDDITFIDVVLSKSDMVSFLQVNRAKRKYDANKGDFNSFEDYLLYHSKVAPSFVWKEQRTEVKVGKFVRRVLDKSDNKNISASDIEFFVTTFKLFIGGGSDKFELVKGEDIRYWYSDENYLNNSDDDSEGNGSLWNSCMKSSDCASYFNIYVYNPNKVSLLILKSSVDDSKIVGRALVWNAYDTSQDKDVTYMDRVYSIEPQYDLAFDEYATIRGWESYKDNSGIGLEVDLEKYSFREYPYMDTFVSLDQDSGNISSEEDREGDYVILRSQTGGFEHTDNVYSDHEGRFIDRDEAVYCEDIDGYVHQNNATYLDYKGEWVSDSADVCRSEYDDKDYYQNDCVFSEYMRDYILDDKSLSIVTNFEGESDYVHEDFGGLLVRIEHDGEQENTIPEYAVCIDDVFYFNDDPSVVERLTNITNVATEKELEAYIIDSEFIMSSKENRNKFEAITQYGDGTLDMSRIKYGMNWSDLGELIKFLLIVIPPGFDKSDCEDWKMEDFNYYTTHILEVRPDLARSLLGVSITDILINDYRKVKACLYTIIAQNFVYSVLRDPTREPEIQTKMVNTWMKLKRLSS